MKIVVTYDFSEENLLKAIGWGKEQGYNYSDNRLLLVDAVEHGIFAKDHIRIANIQHKEGR